MMFGITLAEAERRTVRMAKIIHANSVSIMPAVRQDRERVAQIREAEQRIFEKWYATASIGAKLAHWTRLARRKP